MKNISSKIIAIVLISTLFIACGAKKGGCGLTSDAQKIDQIVTKTQTILIAEAK